MKCQVIGRTNVRRLGEQKFGGNLPQLTRKLRSKKKYFQDILENQLNLQKFNFFHLRVPFNYLHYILTIDESEMLSRFLNAQDSNPVKNDWITQCRKDLRDFNIKEDYRFIKSKSEYSFKYYVQVKSIEYCLNMLQTLQESHSKMDNIYYPEMSLQQYFKNPKLIMKTKQDVFLFRTKICQFVEHFAAF